MVINDTIYRHVALSVRRKFSDYQFETYCCILPKIPCISTDKNNDDIVIRQRTAGGSGDKWWLHQQSARNELLLTVYSPARAAVGEYRLAVELMSGNKLLERTDFTKMYLLFNPWCKGNTSKHSHTQTQHMCTNQRNIHTHLKS